MSESLLRAEIEQLRQVNEELQSRLRALEFAHAAFALPGDELAPLTPTERAIAKVLFDRGGRVVRKDGVHQALYALRPGDAPDLKIIDVLVCKMRPKLKAWEIVTAWGEGYMMRERVA